MTSRSGVLRRAQMLRRLEPVPEVPDVGDVVSPPLVEDCVVPGRDPRRVILMTCTTHGGTPGFTNVVLVKRSGSIVLDSHATGACVLVLDQDAATAMRDTLTEWLE